MIFRIIVFSVLLTGLAQVAHGQYYIEEYSRRNGIEDRRALYERKIAGFSKMKRIGLTLAGVGGGLTVAGVILVSSVDWSQTSNGNGGTTYVTDDPSGLVGVIMIYGGLPMMVTGIILGAIGNKKVKDYSEKLYNLNVGFNVTPNYSGVRLTYRF